jgi:hypothetical protein
MWAMAQSFDETADLLTRCADLRDIVFAAGPGPTHPSRATRDFDEYELKDAYPETSDRIIVCCDYWTIVTADQLKSLATIVGTGAPGFGTYPIMRSVIEHSAWICWILDEKCTALQRIARANLAYLNTAKQRINTATLIYGPESDMKKSARSDYQRFRDEIKKSFADVTLAPIMTIEKEVLPSPKEIINHVGTVLGNQRQWKGVYKFFCEMANHPTLNVAEIIQPGSEGYSVIRIPPITLAQNVSATIGPYLWSLHYICAYLGWPSGPLDAMFDEVAD